MGGLIPLWEIYVPTQFNDGKPIRTRMHREWDSQVRRISGGLTIFKPVIGQWIDPDGVLFKERMIPVRIRCHEDKIMKIAILTKRFYRQDAVFFYKIAEESYIV